jgi:DNA sulfur modification protein DndB
MLWESSDFSEQRQALRSKIAQMLGEESTSPLHSRVVIGERETTPDRCITVEAIQSALKKCRFFDTYGKKNVLQKSGSFDCGDIQETCDLFYPFIEKCLLYIRESCLDEWNKGDRDSGMLTINRGIQAVIRVIDDIVNMLVERGTISPRTQELDDLFDLIKYYLKPLCDYINDLIAEQRKDLRGYFGGGADTRFWRAYQKAVADARPDFNSEGLDEFWQNETKVYNEETKTMIYEIESKIKDIILARLEDYYGDSWLIKGLPKSIYTRAKSEADDTTYEHVSNDGEALDIPIWDYVTLAECKPIILNGRNWSLFFEDTFVRPEEVNLAGGKEPKTDWIIRLNTIMNKLGKNSYSVPVDEYSYVKSIHEWVIGLLVL